MFPQIELALLALVLLLLVGTTDSFRHNGRGQLRQFGEGFSEFPQCKLSSSLRMSAASEVRPVVIGSGPAGLVTAVMLARKGFRHVTVFDQLSEPPSPDDACWGSFGGDRSYNIGLSGRGQKVLRNLGLMDRLEKYSVDVVGRVDWTPTSAVEEPNETIYSSADKSYTTKCLERDRIAACIIADIRQNYNNSISLNFNARCTGLDWKSFGKPNERCVVHVEMENKSNNTVSIQQVVTETELLIGADGARSKVREAIQLRNPSFPVKKFEDKNVRVYRTIPLRFPSDSLKGDKNKSNRKWRLDVNYSARTKSDINIDALPTKEGIYLGVVLYRPWDTRIRNIKTGADANSFFKETFPMFHPFLSQSDLEVFASKNDSTLPKFMYTGPVLHYGKTTALLGDAIHTVKPYFGLGVNSAFEDVGVLEQALNKAKCGSVSKGLELYSKIRGKEAKALVEMSRKFDGGFLTFILPLIVDSICNKALPSIFSRNSIASLQDERYSFTQVRTRKRLDRLMQFTALALTSMLLWRIGQLGLALTLKVGAQFSVTALSKLRLPSLGFFSGNR